jgi:bifunctional DNA-binding transcriptional regulator/antitoxin component of YhaV-PrlF toxin-antitoxin module
METFTVTMDGSGRVLLPSKLRKQLKLERGSKLIARVEKERLILHTREQALREAQTYFSQFRKKGVLWSKELIKDRRREARRELKA